MCAFSFLCESWLIIFFLQKFSQCTHISALFNALVLITAPQFSLDPANSGQCVKEEALPVTSLPCLWKPPKKSEESTMQMSEATFTKHTYDKTKKRKLKRLEDFDPRPLEFRGTAANHLPALLQKNLWLKFVRIIVLRPKIPALGIK